MFLNYSRTKHSRLSGTVKFKNILFKNVLKNNCSEKMSNFTSVMCLATDASMTADVQSRPGPMLSWRLIMKYFLRSFSSIPLNHSRRVVVSYK